MASWTIELRAPSPSGSWTTASIVTAFKFRREINTLYRAEVTIINPPAAVETLLKRDNELRIRETDAPKEWYRGRIRDVKDDPLSDIFNLEVLGTAVLLHDRTWTGRREFPIVPAEISADEIANSQIGEPRAGQVLYYDMESLTNDSPAKMEDLSGNSNDGTITGAVSANGKWGLGRDFDGTDDEIVVTDKTQLQISDDLSIAFWFNAAEGTTGDDFIISKNENYAVWVRHGSFIQFRTKHAGPVTDELNYSADLTDGTWHHVAVTFDKDLASENKKIFVDGAQVAQKTRTDAILTDTTNITIGRNTPSGTSWYDGLLDEAYIYNRALSAAEIRMLAGRNILRGHNGTIDSFTAIGFRSEEERRLTTIDTLARAVGAEWFIDQNASDEDRFNFVTRIGSATPTDTFQFGVTAFLANREVDTESIFNDITVLGYGDGINQIKSRNFHASTIRSTVAIKQTDSATTLDLDDATGFPTSGIVFVGRERQLYTGITGNQLTGITRAYDADGYESLVAYEHEVGIEAYVHADTTTSPDTYHTPEVPQTGSSIEVNGWRQGSYQAPEMVDQNAIDRLAQRFNAKYRNERESLVIKALEETIAADLGDDVTVLDVAGAAYENSPYRVVAYEFLWPASRWTLELANYRDSLDRRMAELGEKMRIKGAFGQGATNFYPFQVAENVKGGSRHAVVDLTIPAEMISVNQVKISRLRLRDFEMYTGVTAGSQTPTSGNNPDLTNQGSAAASDVGRIVPTGTGWTGTASLTIPSHDPVAYWIVLCDIETDSAVEPTWEARAAHSESGSKHPRTNGITIAKTEQEEHCTFVALIPKDLTAGDTVTVEVRHNLGGDATGNFFASIQGVDKHTHTVSIAGHTHPADIQDTTYTSPSVSVFIDGVDKTADVKPAGPFTVDTSNIDLTDAIDWTEGTHTVEFREDTTDKLGRIHASGFVKTFLKST